MNSIQDRLSVAVTAGLSTWVLGLSPGTQDSPPHRVDSPLLCLSAGCFPFDLWLPSLDALGPRTSRM